MIVVIGVLAIAGFLLSLLPTRLAPWRRSLGYLVLALGLSTSIVTPLKTLTGVHCPWSLAEFGGAETFTLLLSERAPALKPGRCWPAACIGRLLLLALFFCAIAGRVPHGSPWRWRLDWVLCCRSGG